MNINHIIINITDLSAIQERLDKIKKHNNRNLIKIELNK